MATKLKVNYEFVGDSTTPVTRTNSIKHGDKMLNKVIDDMSTFVTPEMFGAKGDGVTDDRISFQNAINYAISNNVPLYIPKASQFYAFKSCVSVGSESCVLQIPNTIKIIGATYLKNYDSNAKFDFKYLGTDKITSVILITNSNNSNVGTSIEGISIGCSDNTISGIKTATGVNCVNLNLKNIVVSSCDVAYDLMTMVSKIELCSAWFCSSKGFYIHGVPNINYTSTNLDSCYAMNAYHADRETYGFYFEHMWYSSMTNCACDAFKTAYFITYSRSISLYGCGCERIDRAYQVSLLVGGTVDGFLALPNNSETSENFIYLSGAHGITFNGVHVPNRPNKIFLMDIYTDNIYINDSELKTSEINLTGNQQRVNLPFVLNGCFADSWNIFSDELNGDGIHKGQTYVDSNNIFKYYDGTKWNSIFPNIRYITCDVESGTVSANSENVLEISYSLSQKPKSLFLNTNITSVPVLTSTVSSETTGFVRLANKESSDFDTTGLRLTGIAIM